MRQKGFTLVEILVTLAVGSLIMTGALMSIYQVITGTDRSNSQVVSLTDVTNAARAIKADLMVTQSSNLTDEDPVPQGSVTLTWIDYTNFSSDNASYHSSSYTLSGTELRRNYDGVESIVGRHITDVGFTRNGRVINVVITATGPGAQPRSDTLTFSAYMRAEEAE